MMRLALDSSVLLHMVTPRPLHGQEERSQDALQLLSLSSDYEFVITTPVVAEVLISIPDDRQRAVAGELDRSFTLLAFDTEAAILAAGLWRRRLPSAAGERQIVKVDHHIIGCAVRWNARAFCTFDEKQLKRVQAAYPSIEAGLPARFLAGKGRPLFPLK